MVTIAILCNKTFQEVFFFMDKIIFTAALPPIASAINLDGNGDGARIKLDIPRSDIPAVLQLQGLSGQCFRVTIEEIK